MVLPWKQLEKHINSVAGSFASGFECLWNFLANLIAASFASVPEFEKNTRSAKEAATRRFASSICSNTILSILKKQRNGQHFRITCGGKEGSKHSVTYRNNFSCKEDISAIFSSLFFFLFLCSTFSLSLVSYKPTTSPSTCSYERKKWHWPLSPLFEYTEHFFPLLFKTVIDKHQTRTFSPSIMIRHKSTITAMTA